jgi:hypothetical protein
MARSCTAAASRVVASGAEVVIDCVDLPYELFDVVEEEFCFGEELTLKAAAQYSHNRQRATMRCQNVIRRVAGDEGVLRIGSNALHRRFENLG